MIMDKEMRNNESNDKVEIDIKKGIINSEFIQFDKTIDYVNN